MRLDKISKTKINNAIFDIVLYLILILLATGMVAGFGGSTNIVVKAEENGDVTVNESGYPITNKEFAPLLEVQNNSSPYRNAQKRQSHKKL